jgi:SAM-dependent methyltransferase
MSIYGPRGSEMTSPSELVEGGASLYSMLGELYRKQLALIPHDQYLIDHGTPRNVANHVLTFLWYRPYLPEEGAVLDWGCNHAPDSCLLRMAYGQRLQLHGCDFADSGLYPVFHEFAGLSYVTLDHDNFSLPYDSNSFDVVIGSGTLEHTAMDYESLKELYRVLKPNGVLIISYLPHRFSYHEYRQRVLKKEDFHLRLYGLRETKQMLKRSGFLPVFAGFHTFFWENMLATAGLPQWNHWNRAGARLLYRLIPIHLLCDALCLIAKKVMFFG